MGDPVYGPKPPPPSSGNAKKKRNRNKNHPKNKGKKPLSKSQRKRKRAKIANGTGKNRKILKSAKDKKLKAELRANLEQQKEADESAARAEILLPEQAGLLEAEGPMGRTYKFKQAEIRANVDANSALNVFDLSLPTFGGYAVDYSRGGRHLLLGGRKGHVALMDCIGYDLKTELHLRETVRDVQFLMNENLFAVAQRKYAYIYDSTGMEIHTLKSHVEPRRLDYLPYHYLLVSVGTFRRTEEPDQEKKKKSSSLVITQLQPSSYSRVQ